MNVYRNLNVTIIYSAWIHLSAFDQSYQDDKENKHAANQDTPESILGDFPLKPDEIIPHVARYIYQLKVDAWKKVLQKENRKQLLANPI